MADLKHRYDFVLVFDVMDGNPNGDPDAGNLPRIDPETGNGIVTDVCLKRKVRNFVQLRKNGSDGYEIFVMEKAVLNRLIEGTYQALNIDLESTPKDESDGKKRKVKGVGQGSEVSKARAEMCRRYFDIRTFGAVLSTGANAGQVRGPVQLTFARSADSVVTLEHSITRMAVATEAEAEKQSGDNRTMGRKNTVPYGVYVAHGFVSAYLAAQTGFSEADLDLLWEALANMFEHDRSAARGLMSTRKLIVFEHENALGCAHAHDLFDRVKIRRSDEFRPARAYNDYEVTMNEADLPKGVTIQNVL
jgi:CRISPR-associated protein Csd2